MELTDIMALVKAGYTKDEIAQMEKPQPADPNPLSVPEPVQTLSQTAEPASVPAQVAEPVAVPVAQPAPQQAQTPQPDQPTMADIMQGIAKLTSAIQANAIAQSVIPQGLQTPPKAEDMLAEIIRPTFTGREGI